MWQETLTILSGWTGLDTWTVVTAVLAAMACTLPGNYLVLRRQSLMGDALSHTVLLGVVGAFLSVHWLLTNGWIPATVYPMLRHAALFAGAMLIGMLSAILVEWLQKLSRVEESAALGVIFTSCFALGLILIRLTADDVHIDPECVLYGRIETVVLDPIRGTAIPRAAVMNGISLMVNLALVALFFKELRISAFDPALANTVGIPSTVLHYALMAVTAATLVTAFESVGSILVIAMLIVPAAAAHLLTDRLQTMIPVSLLIAALCGLLGHVLAITVPSLVFSRLGYPEIVDASTAGMMAASCGLLFVLAALFAPRRGILIRGWDQLRVRLRIAREDVLGFLFRLEERSDEAAPRAGLDELRRALALTPLRLRTALRGLEREGAIDRTPGGICLTEAGRTAARQLVRAHRLWESYMARHFAVPDTRLHETAERVEHFIDPDLQDKLQSELDSPRQDPHGRDIPAGDGGR